MEKREIVIKGTGKVSASPDLLVINLNFEVVEREYERTMLTATQHLDALRAAVVSAGHDKKSLKTTAFNVDTEYEHYQDFRKNYKQKFVGYSCTHRLSLEFDLDMKKLGATLVAIADCAAKPQFSVKFSVKDPSAVSEQLLQSAIENARQNAEVLAKAGGVKLGEIKRIDYNWINLNLYSETSYGLAESSAALERWRGISMDFTPMDITPKDIDVSDTVTVIWAME